MNIYLVRVNSRADGSLFVERKPSASINDDYIAISHVWGTPETIQPTHIDGVGLVDLSPGKKDILNILRREDVCGDGWFWMDLFCLDQNPDAVISISEQIMAIPAIYKSSRCVKVLIESPVCDDWQATALRVFSEAAIDQELFGEEELRHARRCPNMLFYDPWFERLWTRQEGLYGMRIEVITLNRVACTRLQPRTIPSATAGWISEGNALAKRTTAQFFIDDKLAYHGLSDTQGAKIRFDVYFDFVYRHRIVIDWYGGTKGPHPSYSPLTEAWRSGRTTTKARDYVLAVFPDIDGYRAPETRRLPFDVLLADALRQLSVQNSLLLTPKFPKGMLITTSSKDSASVWIPQEPTHVGEALDGVFGHIPKEPNTPNDSRYFAVASLIVLEHISITRDTFPEIVRLWESTADTVKHIVHVYPAGPCTGTNRASVQTDEGLLHQYFVEQFASSAVMEYLPKVDYNKLELRTTGVIAFDRVQNIPETTFSVELSRFLVCLMCGTTTRTADFILGRAGFAIIPTTFGKLLGLVNRDILTATQLPEITLISTTAWSLCGFLVGIQKESGVHMVGRTLIPKTEFWDAVERSLG